MTMMRNVIRPGVAETGLMVRPVPGYAAWESCRAVQAGATAFHRWEWLGTMAQALGKHFLPLGFYQSGRLIGLAPLLVRGYGPYRNASWAPLPYLGPLVPGHLLSDALRALDCYGRRNGISLFRLGFAPDAAPDPVILEAAGYTLASDTTMELPLAGREEEELWAAMKYQRRQNIRKAQRAGVAVGSATREDMAVHLPAIMEGVFAPRDQAPPYPAAAPTLVWERYHNDPSVHMAAARYEDATAAVLVTLIDGVHAYMWMGGGQSCYRHVNPNALLYWDAICWARARGCRAIDMVATPDDGIARFKSGFGCTERPYVLAMRETSRAVTVAHWAHGHAASLRREAPGRLDAARGHLRGISAIGQTRLRADRHSNPVTLSVAEENNQDVPLRRPGSAAVTGR